MDNRIPALVFGAFLLIFGGSMMYLQLAAGRRRLQDAGERSEREYYQRQHRRRLQVAGLIILIGILIPAGDSLIPWENAAATFAIYWMTVLGLTFWTILLALGDMLSTKMYTDVTMNRIRQQRSELERAADQLRRSQAERDSGK